MKHVKKALSSLLAVCLLAGLAVLPVRADAAVSTFPDIADPTVGQAVETLRELGVLGGLPDGTYDPDGTLTRAEFCKIAVLIMGKGAEVPAYENRTIFPDVASNHWARGYINLAVNTEIDGTRLILGTGDGLFTPSRPITYGEAVTVILRLLGYGTEANNNWPYGAVYEAGVLALDRDIESPDPNGPITRAEAAILFYNLLFTPSKSGTSVYLTNFGSITEGLIYYSASATADDGTTGVQFIDISGSQVTFKLLKPVNSPPAEFLLGRRGLTVTDSSGQLMAFIPDGTTASRTVTVRSVTAKQITGTDGTVINVSPEAKVYYVGRVVDPDADMSFGKAYPGLNRRGLTVTVCYNSVGNVDLLLVAEPTEISGKTAVAESDGLGAFDSLTGGSTDCRVVKNGAAVPYSSVKKYDVGTYNAAQNTLYICDFRLTGLYESAAPNVYTPTKISLMSLTDSSGEPRLFDVLSCAVPDFEDVLPGAVVTFLFSADGKIAGVKPDTDVRSNALGIVSKAEDSTAYIDLINPPQGLETISGSLRYSGSAANYIGQIVSVTGTTGRENSRVVSKLTLSRINSAGTGELDLENRTLGTAPLSESLTLFERVGKSDCVKIEFSDIIISTVPASKVTYSHKDAQGAVDILILDDVTGDRYSYGLVSHGEEITEHGTVFGDIKNNVTTVTFGNSGEASGSLTVLGTYGEPDDFAGAVMSTDKLGAVSRCAGYAKLTEVTGVTQSVFDASAGTFSRGGVTIPIARDVKCYYRSTGRWEEDVDWDTFILYANSFTVYYDRTPTTGAKVRIIVAN